MAINITMPKWGLTMKEGKITRWFKQEGDSVRKREPFFEVETEKITNKVESTASGVVFQIVIAAGATVPVGAVVAVVAEAGEQPARIDSSVPAAQAAATAPSVTSEISAAKPRFVPASPAARRLAKELNVDLTRVSGSGPEGRVTEADVQAFHTAGPPPPRITPLAAEMARQAGLDISGLSGTGEGGKITRADVTRALQPIDSPATQPPTEIASAPVRVIPFEGMRQAIAANMHSSLQQTAQLTVFSEVDLTEALRWLEAVRAEYRRDATVRVSLNDIIIMAASRALKRFPMMNSNLVGNEILVLDDVNMGIAVALPEGLIVPVLPRADKKDLLTIARQARALIARAREGTLAVEDVTNGTFTVTNVSMFAVDGFTPILKPPETAILGVGRVKRKPAVVDEQICIRSLAFFSLTFDHQVVDGAPANDFMGTLVRYLENPYLIM